MIGKHVLHYKLDIHLILWGLVLDLKINKIRRTTSYHLLVPSSYCELLKMKYKVFKEHILKDLVPRGFDARIKQIQKEY